MKMMRKLAVALLAFCLVMPCFSASVFAADGKIMFTDPKTATGEVVEVKGVVQATSDSVKVGNAEVQMKYDTEMLRFKSGDNVTETSKGTLVYKRQGVMGEGKRVEFLMQFDVLKEGTTKIEVTSSQVFENEGANITCTPGSSTITIEQGTTPVTDVEEPSDDVETQPEGPIVQIAISDVTTITLISDVSDVFVSEQFAETIVTVDGTDFPAWQDVENSNIYLLYAENGNGEKSLYKYDAQEATYQRFVEDVDTTTEKNTSIVATLKEMMQNEMKYVLLGTVAVVVLLLLLALVLGVKLYNRNAELDEIYDEYGIDWDEEAERYVKVAGSKPVKKAEPEVEEVSYDYDDDMEVTLEDDDNEVEVEFFVEEMEAKAPVEEAVEKTLVIPVEEVKAQTTTAPVEEVKEESKEDEYEESLFDDFEMDFIDLDD